MDSRHYWEENGHSVKYENFIPNDGYHRLTEGNLNFATGALHSEDDGDYLTNNFLKKGKIPRQQDPMSHRIIEKRRRDRMNNCLADLSRLIPPDYLKKGRGRVEKTEIIEMAIRHLKFLQDRYNATEATENTPISLEHFRLGYHECVSEVMRYLVEAQGYAPADALCAQLVGHLHRHCDKIMKGDQLNKPRSNPETTSSSSSGSAPYTPLTPVAEPANPMVPSRCATTEQIPLARENNTKPLSLTRRPDPPPPQSTTTDETSESLHSYKFKNNIKQRFSRSHPEESTDVSEDKIPTAQKRRRRDSDEGVGSLDDDSSVAVFALHSESKHYVPLSISVSKLGSTARTVLASRPGALHPVSISVAFHHHGNCLKPEPDLDWRYL